MLYVVGGWSDSPNQVDFVDRYDPRSNQWTPVKPMLTLRIEPGI